MEWQVMLNGKGFGTGIFLFLKKTFYGRKKLKISQIRRENFFFVSRDVSTP